MTTEINIKYLCITNYQPDTKYIPNPNPTTKHHTVVSIQLNMMKFTVFAISSKKVMVKA